MWRRKNIYRRCHPWNYSLYVDHAIGKAFQTCECLKRKAENNEDVVCVALTLVGIFLKERKKKHSGHETFLNCTFLFRSANVRFQFLMHIYSAAFRALKFSFSFSVCNFCSILSMCNSWMDVEHAVCDDPSECSVRMNEIHLFCLRFISFWNPLFCWVCVITSIECNKQSSNGSFCSLQFSFL